MKVLFSINNSIIVIQITDGHLWLTGNTKIVDMEDSHLHNAILWCHRRERSEVELSMTPLVVKGLTYAQWKEILLHEKQRREVIAFEQERKQLQAELDKLQPKEFKKRRIAEIKKQLGIF